MNGTVALRPDVLALDCGAEADRIAGWMVETLATRLHRRGLVVAMSGGIDSSVCAALAVRALGAAKVFGLLLPERDSSSDSRYWGFVPDRNVVGKAFFIWMNFDDFGRIGTTIR